MEPQRMGAIKKKRAKYEWLVILLIIAVAGTIGAGVYNKRTAVKRADLLQNQLSQLRTAVTIYKTLNKTNPPNMAVLANETFHFEGSDKAQPYITNMEIDANGHIIDPFGNTYHYDVRSGWIASSTEGYQNW